MKRVPEALELELAGKTVRVTSPDKVFFTKRGETKLDLIDYYIAVAEPMMGVVGGRPALMQRFPDGASGKSFWQKRVPKGAPEWLETTEVSTPNGTTSQAIVLADIAHVVWAAHMGSLCFHVWPYPAAQPDIADELRIDLDPHGKITFDDIRMGCAPGPSVLHRTGCNQLGQDHWQQGFACFRQARASVG